MIDFQKLFYIFKTPSNMLQNVTKKIERKTIKIETNPQIIFLLL